MDRRRIIEFANSFKHRLAGGLLCCFVLVGAYMFQMFFPGMYIDAFSSSIYLSMWMILFVGALLWTFREKGTYGLPTEVTDWQCVAAFLLITGNQIYTIVPKEIHQKIAPVLSVYTIPALAAVGLVLAGLIKFTSSLRRRLESERQRAILQTQRLQELLSSPPPEQKDVLLVRRLMENKSISQLSDAEYLVLVEGCCTIDPVFFVWMKNQNLRLPSRDIVLCVLVRMRKTQEEILSIFGISNGAYRTMKSRTRGRLGIGDKDLEFLQQELK